jgi:hypothetical protein
VRRTGAGATVEYLGQLLGGLIHLLRSGATPDEELCPLPGDDLVPNPAWAPTRAVTVHAGSDDVWPWVAQMGFGRGGWYGWNPLEREDTGVFGLLPELPPPRVGEVWLDGPGCDESRGAWRVEALEPPRTVVLRTTRDPVSGRELNPLDAPRLFIDSEWTFHLREIAPNHTRLLGRTRVDVGPRWALLPLKWMGGGDTVMQRTLLDGIKIRVEGAQTDALGGQCHPASP